MQSSIERFPAPLPVPFSKAVRAGNLLFLSGVLAVTPAAVLPQKSQELLRKPKFHAGCGRWGFELIYGPSRSCTSRTSRALSIESDLMLLQ